MKWAMSGPTKAGPPGTSDEDVKRGREAFLRSPTKSVLTVARIVEQFLFNHAQIVQKTWQ